MAILVEEWRLSLTDVCRIGPSGAVPAENVPLTRATGPTYRPGCHSGSATPRSWFS